MYSWDEKVVERTVSSLSDETLEMHTRTIQWTGF
jgi:hypothetical protein